MRRLLICCLALLLVCTVSFADILLLPDSILQLEEELFMDDPSLDEVIIPQGITSIGSRVFAHSGLRQITLPASLNDIAPDAFAGCSGITVHVIPGSYAATYAAEHDELDGISYRAFVVGQLYPESDDELIGPGQDYKAVSAMLSSMTATPFRSITTVSNLTANGILTGLRSAFSGADDNDISLFYYSGHGLQGGWLLGTDGECVTPIELREALDHIPGKKVLLIDACYSGALIDTEEVAKGINMLSLDDEPTPTATKAQTSMFVSGFMSAFRSMSRAALPNGALSSSPYYVITACTGDQLSWERHTTISGNTVFYGLFTKGLLQGCGYNEISNKVLSSLPADADKDRMLTLQEMYRYAYTSVYSAGTALPQTVSVYPSGSDQIILGRLKE